ncbi:MAG: pseudaminic acid synthase [Gammaproteobacteria bacterium]|nr:pseudaminic acid synthase [Gammaproteobacteria bacterium]
MNNDIKIANRNIGKTHRPFIIAEMSGNHNQSLDRALEIVEAAAKTGAHAIKLQTYTANTMTINKQDGDFIIKDPASLWNNRTLYELYDEAHTPWEWHKPIFERCKKLGLICFSTPFDYSSVDFLEELNAPCYKIASFENTDVRLIRKVASTGKPMIISTGMANLTDLELIVTTVRNAGCNDFVLLKCTSAYPAKPSDANIATIPHLQKMFNCQVGLSDHTLGIGVAVASVAFGATVIEKHFTLSRADGGVDSAFSLEPHELKNLVEETNRAWQAIGKPTYICGKVETKSKQFRRSLYIVEDLQAGDIITEDNMRAIRPGYGLPVKYYDDLLNKKVVRNVKRGTPVSWDLITGQ